MRAVCYHKENPNAHKKEAGAGAISLKALDQQATPYDGTLGRISSTQEADNGGGMTRTKTAYSKGVLTPTEIKAREELLEDG